MKHGVRKGQVQCRKGVFDRGRDMSRDKLLLQWFLIPRMNFEGCVNIHALCFERRTRVLEEKFLIYPHLGYGDITRKMDTIIRSSNFILFINSP